MASNGVERGGAGAQTAETFQAYLLFAVQKHPIEKVTAYLDCSPNQVYQAKKRCFAKLREILHRMNEQDPELHLELSGHDLQVW